MYGEPRNWKWMVPAMLTPIAGGLGAWLMNVDGGAWVVRFGGFVMICWACVLLYSAYKNCREYFAEGDAMRFEQRQRALAITADSVRLEAAKGVHPETLELLLRDRARRWGLISASKSANRKPFGVLLARPNVTEAFLAHFLKMSNDKTYMPLNMLSDGDKSFDPQKRVTAREMYDDLESLLFEESKITRPFGKYKPGYWIPDWGPEAVAMDFGIDLEQWSYVDEEIETAKSLHGVKTDDLIPLK